ncbi:sensor histidine kinase [Nocardia blacklockiae]|uniref:sensor histidine kinase n=1 Tax=Nocardia blacklockiae TaxID=480036 RepID=UPI001894DDFD|nr:HAMP domain-containing sensor histidine kinase [Nocardia blacklockiae]MBF6175209.1 HAMP domain-containing histidine kinase [Nocardia blacklockiae]
MTRRWRPTIRFRLTLLYAGAFFLAGAVLVAVLYFSMEQWLGRRPGGGAQLIVREYLGTPQSRVRVGAIDELASAVAAQAEAERRATLHAMLAWSLVALGAVGVAATGFGWLLAGRVLAPLQQIGATARRVADDNLHERIALDGPRDEITELADTFDAMLERLDRSFDSQRRFVANASHELRTPLTINRTLLEVALDRPDAPESLRQLGSTLLEVNRRHERLIDGLLVLAGSEQRLTEHRAADLAEIVRHVAGTCAEAARTAEVEVRTDLAVAPVAGDPLLLERLAHNLFDNAIRYNQPGGWVAVRTEAADGRCRLVVDNTGPEVPEYDLDGLFEPFRRLTATTRRADAALGRGAGLGLSIVRSVAQAHGGTVTAAARHGGGLRLTVELPVHVPTNTPVTQQL